MSLTVAAISGVRAGSANPRWDTGDLLVGLHFAVLSLLFWGRAARVRRGGATTPSAAIHARARSLPVHECETSRARAEANEGPETRWSLVLQIARSVHQVLGDPGLTHRSKQ